MFSYLGQLASCLFFMFFSWCSEGLVTIWDCLEVQVLSSFTFDHIHLINGSFAKTNEFILVNVYAPFDVAAQKLLWYILSERLQNFVGKIFCVCGDFMGCLIGEVYYNLKATNIYIFSFNPNQNFIKKHG